MEIKIEAPGHENQEALAKYYEQRLKRKFGNYKFVHAIDVKIKKSEMDSFKVSLQIKPENDKMIFAAARDVKENIALNKSMRKMKVQLEKYKQKHYHNPKTASKYYPENKSNLN